MSGPRLPRNCLPHLAGLSFLPKQKTCTRTVRRPPSAFKEVPAMAAVPDFNAANDPDTLETQEWLEALETVLDREGPERAHFLLEKLIDKARRSGAHIPYNPNTAYIN